MTSPSFQFLDGKTSRPHRVQLEFGHQSLALSEGHDVIVKWNFTDILVKADWSEGVGAIFGVRGHPDMGLAVNDYQVFLDLQKKLPLRHRASYIIPVKCVHLLGLGVAAVAAAVILFPAVSHLASWATYLVPHALEKKLGDMALSDMTTELGQPCDDPEAMAALKKITSRLTAAHKDKALSPDVHFYKNAEQNAFTLPGEHMVVLTGFLKQAKDESEVAGVLAHEMGHMANRDALEAFIEAQGFGMMSTFIGSSGAYGNVAHVASVMQVLRYSREKEFAADQFSVHMLQQAGYPPTGMSGFLKHMSAEHTGKLFQLAEEYDVISTHPETAERIRRIGAVGGGPEHYKASLSGAEFLRLKEACAK